MSKLDDHTILEGFREFVEGEVGTHVDSPGKWVEAAMRRSQMWETIQTGEAYDRPEFTHKDLEFGPDGKLRFVEGFWARAFPLPGSGA